VIPANEEAILARETVQVVRKSREQATGNSHPSEHKSLVGDPGGQQIAVAH
jgi:hypothetical protein